MTPVHELVKAFGGIRPMQEKLGEKHASLIQGWQETGNVPHYREAQVRAAAERYGVKLSDRLMRQVFPNRDDKAA